jgi:long-chain acyl-CoA synthetase
MIGVHLASHPIIHHIQQNMASFGSEYLVTDDLTILLGLIAATVFLLNNLYKPQPLVHPILLGRQSDVARVRQSGESAVYRNYGTGLMGRVRIYNTNQLRATIHLDPILLFIVSFTT